MALENETAPGPEPRGGLITTIDEDHVTTLRRYAQGVVEVCGASLDNFLPRRTALGRAIRYAACTLAVLDGRDEEVAALNEKTPRELRAWVAQEALGGEGR
jgi:hypothetical protein